MMMGLPDKQRRNNSDYDAWQGPVQARSHIESAKYAHATLRANPDFFQRDAETMQEFIRDFLKIMQLINSK